MDNKQAITSEDVAWLAGAFDADGHLTMRTYNTKRGKNCVVEIGWTNTSRVFLCKVLNICKALDTNLHIVAKSRPKKWKQAWTVRIGKLSKIQSILSEMIPYLTVKLERATLLLEFVERRFKLANDRCGGDLKKIARYAPYNKNDYWYFDKVTELNQRGYPASTTIPNGSRTQGSPKRTAQLICDDMVWPTGKLVEV